jgi:hypothetical protein
MVVQKTTGSSEDHPPRFANGSFELRNLRRKDLALAGTVSSVPDMLLA